MLMQDAETLSHRPLPVCHFKHPDSSREPPTSVDPFKNDHSVASH